MDQLTCPDLYDKAALSIFKEWGIDPDGPVEDDCINPIYRKNIDGGVLYVGDQRAARDETLLSRLGIRAVVNCAPNLPNHHERQVIKEKEAINEKEAIKEKEAINDKQAINEKEAINDKQAINENHHEEKAISYLRFPIGKWKANSGEDDFLLQTFLATFLQFVATHLSAGDSVLIHCMAGAHRAGIAAVIALAFLKDKTLEEAMLEAKRARPAICPIGDLPLLLERTQKILPRITL